MKSEMLKAIDEKIASLDEKDGTSILYWGEFRSWVENFKPDKKSIKEREQEFYEDLVPHVEKYGAQMVREFYDYWIARNKGGRKMLFEMQKVFDIPRRLATWARRNSKDDSKGSFKPQTDNYNK